MSNDYYNHGSVPATGSSLSSATMRAEFDAIATGMDKLPPLTGNNNEVVVVNAGATGQASVPRAALMDTTIVDAVAKTTPVDADLLPLVDSAASNVLKNLTWGNLKATLKTWIEATPFTALQTTTLTATGSTNLGDASTDTVTVNGYMGVGAASTAETQLTVTGANRTGVNQYGTYSYITGSSAATGSITGVYAQARTAAAAFTVAGLSGLRVGDATKGAGSSITNQTGIEVADQTQGTNNYGITSLVSSGTNKWNIFAGGTAANYFAGNVLVGGANTTGASAGTGATFQLQGGYAEGIASNTYSEFDFLRHNAGAIVANGNQLGRFMARGWNGTSYTPAAAIDFFVDGTPGATNDMPGRITFSTTADGSGTLTERLRIDSAGNLGLGVTPSAWGAGFSALDMGGNSRISGSSSILFANNAFFNGTNWIYKNTAAAANYSINNTGVHSWSSAPSGTAGNAIAFTQSLSFGLGTTLALEGATSAAGTGIAFPATQLASSNANTFDDYEEGTWTPTFSGWTTAPTTAQGTYTKKGREVTVAALFRFGTIGAGTTIQGLPFVVNASSYCPALVLDTSAGAIAMYAWGVQGTASIQFVGATSIANYWQLSITYHV